LTWWDLVLEAGDTFLVQHGVLAAFVYLALEEAGVPIPVPGDFLMLALGARAREGGIVLWQVIAAMEAGTILGSSLLYLLARRGGRGLVERYGPFIGIGPAQLDRAERHLQRHGAIAVVLGRLLPGLRVLTAIACGIFRVPFRVFLPAMSLGSLIYIVGYTMLGYFAGPAVLGVFEALHLPLGLVGSGGLLLVVIAGLVLVRRGLPHPLPRPDLRPWQRARVGLLAGLLATLGALLTLELLVVVAGDLAWRLPDSLPAVAALLRRPSNWTPLAVAIVATARPFATAFIGARRLADARSRSAPSQCPQRTVRGQTDTFRASSARTIAKPRGALLVCDELPASASWALSKARTAPGAMGGAHRFVRH
jgi:membrane protein DedA with SNARE-associated domain